MADNALRGPLAWFVKNHVAANLLMALIVIMGVVSMFSIRQEVFPEVELDMISVSVVYPGASPEEVEEAICTRIEEKISSIDGVKAIQSRASEGVGSVIVELERSADAARALDDVKAEVDRITTFPDEAEEPMVVELTNRTQVINLVIFGEVGERTLKVLAEQTRNDLTEMDNISQAEISGVRDYQISVEVSEQALRRYGLTFAQVSTAVRRSSLDLPGGSVKTEAGEILVRTKGQRYTGPEFERIVVVTRPDGATVTLGQIATVIDGFDEDAEFVTRFDGKPAALVQIFRVAEQDAIDVADTVKAYIAETELALPEGVEMEVSNDRTIVLKGRRDLLMRNGALGLTLVFVALLLFLNFRLAFWVTMGIPISFMGAFWLIPQFGTTINLISLFAFIISLGIVVDDAIVVGENIYAHWERGKTPLQAAVEGALEMVKPVTFAVLTTVVAFMPLLYVEGIMGKFMRNIPVVVIAVLMTSLIESLLILPVHLSSHRGRRESNGEEKKPWPLERLRRQFGRGLNWCIHKPYAALLKKAVAWRYLTLALFCALLFVTFGWVRSGNIKFIFFPKVESDTVSAKLSMPQGASLEQSLAIAERIEEAAKALQQEIVGGENGEPAIEHIFTVAGGQTKRGGAVAQSSSGTHLAEVSLQLLPAEVRSVPSREVAQKWREMVGPVAGAESLTFASSLFSSGTPIEIQLRGDRFEELIEAADRLKEELANYPGVIDIEDSFREGKQELKLKLKPAARTLGLTLEDLARQMRQGYYGEEALRIQRGRDDIKVMVRYPAAERSSLGDVEKMRIRTPSGAEVPFSQVAEVELGRGYASINREERKRVVSVTADVEEEIANAQEIVDALQAEFLPRLLGDYPGLGFSLEGQDKNRKESLGSLAQGFAIALFGIYLLLAVPFRAYTQPLVVMSAIPFGIVGAVWGHVLMGLDLSILSMFGIVAVSGVVVNDSLIMIDYINRTREAGAPLHQAVMDSGKMRFRPILLTTLTTFFGLLPMVLERSMQAQFLVPMAVSMAFGIVTATSITLLLIPSLYTILEDFMGFITWLFGFKFKRWEASQAAEAAQNAAATGNPAQPE